MNLEGALTCSGIADQSEIGCPVAEPHSGHRGPAFLRATLIERLAQPE